MQERIRETIDKTAVMYKGIRVKVMYDFWLWQRCGKQDDLRKLVTVVDARLYIGKENGKNQVVSKSSI